MAKILIVDDDEGILEAVTAILEFEGHEVSIEENPTNVLKKVSEVVPDIILLDLLLAGHSGDEIAKELKEDKSTTQIPIIMVSAHPTAEVQARKAGADDFLAKPFDIDELLSKITKLTS